PGNCCPLVRIEPLSSCSTLSDSGGDVTIRLAVSSICLGGTSKSAFAPCIVSSTFGQWAAQPATKIRDTVASSAASVRIIVHPPWLVGGLYHGEKPSARIRPLVLSLEWQHFKTSRLRWWLLCTHDETMDKYDEMRQQCPQEVVRQIA